MQTEMKADICHILVRRNVADVNETISQDYNIMAVDHKICFCQQHWKETFAGNAVMRNYIKMGIF